MKAVVSPVAATGRRRHGPGHLGMNDRAPQEAHRVDLFLPRRRPKDRAKGTLCALRIDDRCCRACFPSRLLARHVERMMNTLQRAVPVPGF